ncbi:hypothetical protein MWU78_10195 [Arenibacter sp. F26102]|uniref:hypothetical protein n=1 Tax=Arenibacter sp. F26102 TaxID=2926416 RepID=UPI001FF3309A|nr:hypothetical protein [Arenibacter sp. F26102]MCK0146016.1 hypothetical protein [Arenibacter sp. F26102]
MTHNFTELPKEMERHKLIGVYDTQSLVLTDGLATEENPENWVVFMARPIGPLVTSGGSDTKIYYRIIE